MACTRAETAHVRGTYDLIMFSTMALASLSAGGLLHRIGWASTNMVSVILLLLIVISIFRAARDIKRIDEHTVAITPDGG
jgi:branched-subunit amino acid permease